MTDSVNISVSISREYCNGDSVGLGIDIGTWQKMIDNEHSTFYQADINGRAADVYKSAESVKNFKNFLKNG